MTHDTSAAAWTRRDTVTQGLLFLLAVVSGMHVGGEMFDSLVNDGVWSASIDAARGWEATGVNPGAFYSVFSLLLMVVSIVTLSVGWRARPPVRFWLRSANALFLIVVAATLVYYFPELMRIRTAQALSIPDTELAERIRRWILLDAGREVMMFAGFLCTLHALGLMYRARALRG